MSTPLHQMRLTSRMKKKRRHLSGDKKLVVDRKSFWHELISRFTLLVTFFAQRKKRRDTGAKKRVLPDGNTRFKTNEFASNFYTDLLSQYWHANVYAVIVAVIFGYIYKQALDNYAMTTFWFFVIKSSFIIVLLLVIIAAVYAVEERYSIYNVCNAQTNKTNTKGSREHWLTKNDALQVLKRMPRWLSDPEMETANWFNALLSRLWPLIERHLLRKMDDILGDERSLNDYVPFNEFTELKVSKARLGQKVPCITGIHVMMFGVKREVIIVDADIIYDSDIDFRVSGSFKLFAGLKNLYFRTNLRITIGPLFRDKPTIGNIGITFLGTPTVNWKFIGILRFLNSNFVKSLVARILATFLKNPRCITTRIAKFIPLRERNIREPKGLLCVEVIEAKDLPRAQSTVCCRARADAFCTVTVGDEIKYTPVVTFSDNPEWNRSFNFIYHRRTRGDVEVFVQDEYPNKDVIIGGVVIPVQQIINELNGREFNIQIRDPNLGEHVYNHLGNPSLLAVKISYFELSANIKKLKTWNRSTRNMPVAALSVLIDYATGLETVSQQIQSPYMRLMVRVNVGNQFQVTSVKERSGAPLWDESLHFLVFSPRVEMVHIEVVDVYGEVEDSNQYILGKTEIGKLGGNQKDSSLSKKGTVLGYVTLAVRDVLDAPRMKTEGFYQLEGFLEKANIKVLMAMRITEYSNAYIENSSKTRTMFPEDEEEEPEPADNQQQLDGNIATSDDIKSPNNM